jgi:spermidine synthase
MLYLPVILMGASSIVLQILCLRQLLATFSGNELIIGITFAVWLIIVALGSFAGSRINNKNAFGLSFISVALVSQLTIILIKSVRPVAGFDLGEVIPLVTTAGWTVLSMSVLCAAIGIQFPLAVSYLKERAPEVYSFEAAGAFAGGVLFTFIFAGRTETYTLAMIAAIINILVSFYLMRKKIVLLLLILPAVFYMGGAGIMPVFQYQGVELVKHAESRYGEIVVLKIKDQLNVYSSEKFLFSYPDHQTEETKAHFPMTIQPSAGKVLIVGGSPAVIREFLRYPVEMIDFVEIDPVLMGISKGLLSMDDREYLDDKRVKLLHTDARKYIKSLRSPQYDLIVLNIPEPSTANINRYY